MLVVDIEKRIGDFTLKVCFKTVDGLLSLLGSSGSGKSMTLKCIAGLEKPDKGIIILNNRVLFDSEKKINLTPQERRVGYMFQQYALFPNMSVGQNIEAALHYLPKKQRNDVVREKLFEFNLQELESKKPAELSGGEQQRTALARIMASNPEILLLDEPFSALDNYLKWQLLVEMKEQISRFDKDVIFVTHNVDEVVALSENICVLNNGKSEPVMKASDAHTEPKTVSTAKLFGCKNFSRLQLKSSCLENDVFTCIDWGIDLKAHSDVGIESKKLVAGVFSQNIELVYADIETNDYIPCTISQVIKIEGGTNVTLKIDGKDNYLSATLPLGINVETKKPVRAHIAAEKVLLLEE